jgi:hypothetical protein
MAICRLFFILEILVLIFVNVRHNWRQSVVEDGWGYTTCPWQQIFKVFSHQLDRKQQGQVVTPYIMQCTRSDMTFKICNRVALCVVTITKVANPQTEYKKPPNCVAIYIANKKS